MQLFHNVAYPLDQGQLYPLCIFSFNYVSTWKQRTRKFQNRIYSVMTKYKSLCKHVQVATSVTYLHAVHLVQRRCLNDSCPQRNYTNIFKHPDS
jgi:hypothetical protein